jgi:cysteinyl-tRNA synthetase
MAIQIYNTLTRQKEEFVPIDPPNVTIYNCGPTVYDRFHIGNARPFVFMDIARRYFEYRGYKVKFVQNITDIDDKIINRANAEGVSASAITERFIPFFYEDSKKLRVRPASNHPRATEHIADIIRLIQRLEQRKLAYASAGSVYFSVKKFKGYGKLSGRKGDDMLEGARVEISEEKHNPADFALWKAAKPGEPSWESPWGPGRPGWHIECSAMAMKHLGETIDIHSGGSDLIFPHHENEIAQSEGATGKPFARYWMHNGFLNIEGEKMSKSLGNFLKIDQVLERHSPAALRYFLLSAHYRHPLDQSEEAMEEAGSAVRRINDAIGTGQKILDLEQQGGGIVKLEEVDALRAHFEMAMDDDFNTPRALAVLFDVVGLIHESRNALINLKDQARMEQLRRLAALVDFGCELRDFFSLESDTEKGGQDEGLTKPLIKLLIETRQMARKEKKFAISDRVRDRLAELGIILEDHPQGTLWKRKDEG